MQSEQDARGASSNTSSGAAQNPTDTGPSSVAASAGSSNDAGDAAAPQKRADVSIVTEGRYQRVTIDSGPLQGHSFVHDTEGPRGIAAARDRMNAAQHSTAPEEEAEEDLPAHSFHDGSGRQISEEEYRRLEALELAEMERRKGEKKGGKKGRSRGEQ